MFAVEWLGMVGVLLFEETADETVEATLCGRTGFSTGGFGKEEAAIDGTSFVVAGFGSADALGLHEVGGSGRMSSSGSVGPPDGTTTTGRDTDATEDTGGLADWVGSGASLHPARRRIITENSTSLMKVNLDPIQVFLVALLSSGGRAL